MYLFRPINSRSTQNPSTVPYKEYFWFCYLNDRVVAQYFYSLNLTAMMMAVWFNFFNGYAPVAEIGQVKKYIEILRE